MKTKAKKGAAKRVYRAANLGQKRAANCKEKEEKRVVKEVKEAAKRSERRLQTQERTSNKGIRFGE